LDGAGNTGPSNIGDYDNTSYVAGVGERNPNYHDDGGGGPSRYFYTSKATKAERTLDGSIDNAHPTVKPQDLMEWLVTLVTKEGQRILDPFAGSGTTLKAAKNLNREFVGIEKQEKWADVARVRAGLTPNDPSHVRDDSNQNGLEEYS
jgi:DNA modification methylase